MFLDKIETYSPQKKKKSLTDTKEGLLTTLLLMFISETLLENVRVPFVSKEVVIDVGLLCNILRLDL